MGLQVRPTGMFKSWTTTPKRAKIPAAAGAPAVVVVWQHCRGPVVQVSAGEPVGVATARIAREEKIASLKNIVSVKFVERLLSVRLEKNS